MINLFKVFMGEGASDAVSDVLRSGYIGEGDTVKKFEKNLSGLWGVEKERVTALNSATSALDLAMHLCNISEGDEVIATPITCFATNVHLKHRKANIVWVDVDPVSGNIDCDDAAKKITDKTKAIIVVDYGGNACDYDRLREFSIPIIEDASHATLTTYKGDHVAKRGGDFVCFSFQAIKHLTCGDGGAIVVPTEMIERTKRLRWYGFDRDKSDSFRCSQDVKEAGFKYHMNNINASIGLSNLPYVQHIVNEHKRNAKVFCEKIQNKKVIVPQYDKESSYWLFTILVDDRKEFVEYMKFKGIATSQVHNRNDVYTIFDKFRNHDLEGVNSFSSRNISIPVGWWLKEEEIDHIVESINSWK